MAVYKREDRDWWFVDFVVEINGKKIRVKKKSPVNTSKGAEAHERKLRQEMADGKKEESLAPAVIPTFRYYWPRFKERAFLENKPSQIRAKDDIWGLHLEPVFGNIRLDNVTVEAIDKYKKAKLDQEYSKKSINNQLTVLRTMLGLAVDEGIIPGLPKIQKFKGLALPEIDFLSFEEADLLVNSASNGPSGDWQDLIYFALKTGLRLGEMVPLKRKYVFLQGSFVRVAEGAWQGQVGLPKGKKVRNVPLAPGVVEMLRRRFEANNSGLVFPFAGDNDHCAWHLSKAYGAAGLQKRVWDPISRKYRIEGERALGWHTLRHTCCSHLVMRGVALKTVQEIMGHKDIQTTMRYAHLSPGVTNSAVSLIDSPPIRPQEATQSLTG